MVEELKKIITEEKDEIRRRYNAEIKATFGSYVRGNFKGDSVLEILVDFDEDVDRSDVFELERFLQDKLECLVDVVQQYSLREELRPFIFSETIKL